MGPQAAPEVPALWMEPALWVEPLQPGTRSLSCSMRGRRCRDLLVQLYLQRPELRVLVPEALLHGEGATASSICKVRAADCAQDPS